jgi:hypothetical protein
MKSNLPPVPNKQMKKIESAPRSVPAYYGIAICAAVFVCYLGVGIHTVTAQDPVHYGDIDRKFVAAEAVQSEETTADSGNFGDLENNTFVARLPYSVYINPDRIKTNTSSSKKTSSSDSDSSNSSSSSSSKKNTSSSSVSTSNKQSSITFTLLYDMNVRESADYGNTLSQLKSGTQVEIVDVSYGSNSSVWGKTDSGYWICIQDANGKYLR